MEIRVLGSLEVVGAHGAVAVSARKHRRLLGALIVSAGAPVPVDVLLEAVWDGAGPPSARKLLQHYVAHLRTVLPAPAKIVTDASAYVLDVPDGAIDAARFERLLAEAVAAREDGNAALAASLTRRGLDLWRGHAYGELAYEEFARVEAERLEELRLVALEELFDAHLELGRHADVLADLQALAVRHPLRERLRAQTMTALYRSGRQADALQVYAAARASLDELGLEPSQELRDLQRRVLQQDPDLARDERIATEAPRLPAAPNRLIGRRAELDALQNLLARGSRLVVLTGAGGSGKTRLALEAARRCARSFANGAAFVDVNATGDVDLLVAAIVRSLELPSSVSTVQALAEVLATREQLLVLDNGERLGEARAVTELLAGAPRLTLLVTSRRVLHLSGEQVFPVEPLGAEAAGALFAERAHEADARVVLEPEAATIAAICERLDRLPLAIELAARRVRAIAPRDLLDRLERRLPLLSGGPGDLPARQLTMRSTIEWSVGAPSA